MAKQFLTGLNLNSSEIQNVVLHQLAVDPAAPKNGQFWENTTSNRVFVRLNGVTKDITGRIDDVLAAVGANAIQFVDNGDGTLSLNILAVNATDDGFMAAIDKIKLDASTALATPDTLVERDANGDSAFNEATVASVGVASNSVVNRGFVETLINGGVNLKGQIDASANPDYPAASLGDAYVISVAGKIGGASGTVVEAGDMIIAFAANVGGTEAAVGGDWNIVQFNLEAASEILAGKIRIATSAEVVAGVDDTSAVTPLKLQEKIDLLQVGANSFNQAFGNTVDTNFVIAHGLGSANLDVSVYITATGEEVVVDVKVNATNITIDVDNAPANNELTVVALG